MVNSTLLLLVDSRLKLVINVDLLSTQVALISVPLMLMSITLPHGADIFWKILDDEFNHEDWKVRFSAVEKTTLLFRFLIESPVKKSQALRSTLSHAFCHLISSMDDKVPQVSQRATIYLGTIHDKAIEAVLVCLEYQFDMMPVDRPIILKNLFQLFNTLVDRKILTWEFFANRFESIINEIQETKHIKTEDLDPAANPIPNHNTTNGIKENKAEKPTNATTRTRPKSGTDSVRSLAQNLKHPYKRTYSAPAGIVINAKTNNSNQNKYQDEGADYRRQQSAPLLKNKPLNATMSRLASQSGTLSEDMDNWRDLAVTSLDIEEEDKETLHLLVFLFMHFLSYPNQTEIPDNKSCVKYLAVQKCFHSLYSLIGYDEVQQRFTTMPHKIRLA